jgi:hypothetical protein
MSAPWSLLCESVRHILPVAQSALSPTLLTTRRTRASRSNLSRISRSSFLIIALFLSRNPIYYPHTGQSTDRTSFDSSLDEGSALGLSGPAITLVLSPISNSVVRGGISTPYPPWLHLPVGDNYPAFPGPPPRLRTAVVSYSRDRGARHTWRIIKIAI